MRGAPVTNDETPATEVGQSLSGRVLEGLWWSALVLVPAWVVSRFSDQAWLILGLGVAVALVVFVAFVRRDGTVVTSEEIRLRKRTIRRSDVARVTSDGETTALVFRDSRGGVVALADLMGQSRAFRDALHTHGWPDVERQG